MSRKNKDEKLSRRDERRGNGSVDKDSKYYTSFGSWILFFVLSIIPGINLIYWLGLLLGIGKQAKVSFVRANFVVLLIALAIGAIVLLVIGKGPEGFMDIINSYIETIRTWIESFIATYIK